MAASATTAYDPAEDEGGSESSDVELDAESQQELRALKILVGLRTNSKLSFLYSAAAFWALRRCGWPVEGRRR